MGKKAHNIQKEDIETYNGLLVEDPLVKGGGAMNPVGQQKGDEGSPTTSFG